MKKNIVRHQLALNLDDPEQNEMDKFLKTFTNVSAKLKYLVLTEMRKVPQMVDVMPGGGDNVAVTITPAIEEEKAIPSFALDLLL